MRESQPMKKHHVASKVSKQRRFMFLPLQEAIVYIVGKSKLQTTGGDRCVKLAPPSPNDCFFNFDEVDKSAEGSAPYCVAFPAEEERWASWNFDKRIKDMAVLCGTCF